MAHIIRVLAADDTTIARSGIERMLAPIQDIELIGVTDVAQKVVSDVARLKPDVLLIDLRWGEDETAGASAIEQVAKQHPSVRIIAMSGFSHLMRLAREKGAISVIGKGFTIDELAETIRAVMQNPSFPGPTQSERSVEMGISLTDREMMVLRLLAKGMSDKEIHAALGGSLHTIKNHVQSIMEKLQASSRTQAVAQAVKRHIITLEEL